MGRFCTHVAKPGSLTMINCMYPVCDWLSFKLNQLHFFLIYSDWFMSKWLRIGLCCSHRMKSISHLTEHVVKPFRRPFSRVPYFSGAPFPTFCWVDRPQGNYEWAWNGESLNFFHFILSLKGEFHYTGTFRYTWIVICKTGAVMC